MNNDDRAKAIRGLMGEGGFSRTDANMIVDLTEHAIKSAENAFMSVCDTAPSNIRMQVAINACVALQEKMESAITMMHHMGVKFKVVGR